ncbi:hypothetical protein SSP35_01_03620 [Streptomyces sp. NBRC 110611]|uniref:DUF4232 domain-containing protein n=1 Tax=Streptomyces sp. NBRC 110611 TaxID=1621259 RepID=UPI00082B7A1E|nr:DUF4232 domain-containing protein [Streptomyces sp. NBRC 110611]GAU65025.1 hypothetical protein SSP35_01_03620 [Streptomyces sp. NBRC 110611]
MRRRSLVAATAALTLTVTLGLALVGCGGSPRMMPLHAACTTKGLSWKLTLLKKKPHSTHRDATLSIANKGPEPCAFRGFPRLEVRIGKGPSSDAKGRGRPAPIDLPRGGTLTTPLRYKDSDSRPPRPHAPNDRNALNNPNGPNGPNASHGCLISNDTAWVTAPHDRGDGQPITARDEAGKPAQMNICGDTIWMSPPKEVAE